MIWICFGIFAAEHYKWPKICKKHQTNKAKAISAELLDLNLKNKLEKGQINNMKREKNGEKQKHWKKKTPKNGRKWMILKEAGRNRHGAKNVRYGFESVRHGEENVQHGAKNVRHGAKNVWHGV